MLEIFLSLTVGKLSVTHIWWVSCPSVYHSFCWSSYFAKWSTL